MKKVFIAIGILLAFVFVLPFIINLIVSTPSCTGFITDTNRNMWIGYYSAIIGGGMTLLGVVMTITWQDKKRKEDLAVQFKPIIKIIKNKCYFRKDSDDFLISLKIENIGRGEAKNLKVFFKEHSLREVTTLPGNETTYFSINLAMPVDITHFEEVYTKEHHEIKCIYTDLYEIKKYTTTAKIEIIFYKNREIKISSLRNEVK